MAQRKRRGESVLEAGARGWATQSVGGGAHIERFAEGIDVVRPEAVGHRGVEVGLESVHLAADAVAIGGDAEHSEHGHLGRAAGHVGGVRAADDVVDVHLLEGCAAECGVAASGAARRGGSCHLNEQNEEGKTWKER